MRAAAADASFGSWADSTTAGASLAEWLPEDTACSRLSGAAAEADAAADAEVASIMGTGTGGHCPDAPRKPELSPYEMQRLREELNN